MENKNEIILNKIFNIITVAGTTVMIVLLLIYLILYPSESEPAAELATKSEYESQQLKLRSEFIIKEDPGTSPGLETTKLNEIEFAIYLNYQVKKIYPNKKIRPFILWTDEARLDEVFL